MSPVNFKRRLCRPVEFKGQGRLGGLSETSEVCKGRQESLKDVGGLSETSAVRQGHCSSMSATVREWETVVSVWGPGPPPPSPPRFGRSPNRYVV